MMVDGCSVLTHECTHVCSTGDVTTRLSDVQGPKLLDATPDFWIGGGGSPETAGLIHLQQGAAAAQSPAGADGSTSSVARKPFAGGASGTAAAAGPAGPRTPSPLEGSKMQDRSIA